MANHHTCVDFCFYFTIAEIFVACNILKKSGCSKIFKDYLFFTKKSVSLLSKNLKRGEEISNNSNIQRDR